MNKLIEYAKKHDIELDTNKLWEMDYPHDERSKELMDFLMAIDHSDYFCWKAGGDGDNGEELMYQMDIYFKIIDHMENNLRSLK